MITVNLDAIEEVEVWETTLEDGSDTRVKAGWFLNEGAGTRSSAALYFEIEPGHSLANHYDTAEETILVLEGTVEVSVGKESGELSRNRVAVVPTMAPHSVRNIGEETARLVGFFSGGVVASIFDRELMPMNRRVVVVPSAADGISLEPPEGASEPRGVGQQTSERSADG